MLSVISALTGTVKEREREVQVSDPCLARSCKPYRTLGFTLRIQPFDWQQLKSAKRLKYSQS